MKAFKYPLIFVLLAIMISRSVLVKAQDVIDPTPAAAPTEIPAPTDGVTPTPTDPAGPTATPTPPSVEIQTPTATASAEIDNNVNTNITGQQIIPVVINNFSGNTAAVDLSTIDPSCPANPVADQPAAVNQANNQNNADVTNNLSLNVSTGGNVATDSGSLIQTADASVNANISNVVNTNLSGNCGFFNVMNFFENQNGDVILPYELGFIDSQTQNIASSLGVNDLKVVNTNNALVNNNIQTSADTGNNVGGAISTGSSQTTIQILNDINNNLTGDNWLLVTINNLGTWQGNLQGWWGNYYQIPHQAYLWFQMPSTMNNFSIAAVNGNQGTITNDIRLAADTGNNIGGANSIIRTGNANINLNIFNLLNTNISGNHWFYSTINFFGDFTGNIIFPRPDLAVTIKAAADKAYPGDKISMQIAYFNQGNYSADNTVLKTGENRWFLGKIAPGQSGIADFDLSINPQTETPSVLVAVVLISTTTDEPNQSNNRAAIDVSIQPPETSAAATVSQNNSDSLLPVLQITPSKAATVTPSALVAGYQQSRNAYLRGKALAADTNNPYSEERSRKPFPFKYLVMASALIALAVLISIIIIYYIISPLSTDNKRQK